MVGSINIPFCSKHLPPWKDCKSIFPTIKRGRLSSPSFFDKYLERGNIKMAQVSNTNSKSKEEITYQNSTGTGNPENKWYLRWRHFAAYMFIAICLFDFIIMPTIYEIQNDVDLTKAVELSLKYPEQEGQTMALQTFLSKRTWEPLTLRGSGMFFLAFGGILGVSAWSRGKEKLESMIKS